MVVLKYSLHLVYSYTTTFTWGDYSQFYITLIFIYIYNSFERPLYTTTSLCTSTLVMRYLSRSHKYLAHISNVIWTTDNSKIVPKIYNAPRGLSSRPLHQWGGQKFKPPCQHGAYWYSASNYSERSQRSLLYVGQFSHKHLVKDIGSTS